MARIRTIKPEFWTSEQIVECSPNARLMFIGLMNFADDNGVHPAKPMRIKMQVFPGDAFGATEIDGFLCELEDAGLIQRYEANEEQFLIITGFTKHQKIDQPSYKFPLPNGKVPENPKRRRKHYSEIEQGVNGKCSANTERTDDERSPPEGNGMEGKGKEGIPPKSPRGGRKKPATQIPDDFTPNQSCKAKALELGVSLNNELPKFIDHALANDRRQVDWQAAFRTWLGNSNNFAPRQAASSGGPAPRKELTLD